METIIEKNNDKEKVFEKNIKEMLIQQKDQEKKVKEGVIFGGITRFNIKGDE